MTTELREPQCHLLAACDKDDPLVRKMVEQIGAFGASIIEVRDHEEAQQCMESLPPNSILCAALLCLDTEKSLAVSRLVREHPSRGHTPIVLVVEQDSQDVVRLAMREGINACVQAPLESDESLNDMLRFWIETNLIPNARSRRR